MSEPNYQQLVERIERLEQSFADHSQRTTKMLATLEHISKTLDDMVNGKGTVRCAEHGAQVSALEKVVELHHTESIGFTRRVNDEFHTFMADSTKDCKAMDTRVDKLEQSRAWLIGAIVAAQVLVGLAIRFL